MALSLNQHSLESALKEVPNLAMIPIELLRVHAVQVAHASGKSVVHDLDNKVVMVPHEAVGMAEPLEAVAACSEELEKEGSISVVLKDLLSLVSPGGNVVKSTRKLYP